MHFWQKMWPQMVDDALTSSFMQTGQLNIGSFGISFTGSGTACATLGGVLLVSGVSTMFITRSVLGCALEGLCLGFIPRDSRVFTCSSRASPGTKAAETMLIDAKTVKKAN